MSRDWLLTFSWQVVTSPWRLSYFCPPAHFAWTSKGVDMLHSPTRYSSSCFLLHFPINIPSILYFKRKCLREGFKVKKKCGRFHIRGFYLLSYNPLPRSHLVVRSAEAWQEPPLVTQVDLVEKLLWVMTLTTSSSSPSLSTRPSLSFSNSTIVQQILRKFKAGMLQRLQATWDI